MKYKYRQYLLGNFYAILRNFDFNSKPTVSVLVPAFQAESFICETLDSLNFQVFRDFQILISIDKSDDNTELITRRWCRMHKHIQTQIFCQKHRLGWVKNINFLLEKVQTKYFMIMPHDDTLDKNYLQKMIQCLKTNKKAIMAYCDMKAFGIQSRLIIQKSTRGSKLERTLQYLKHNAGAAPFRGLVNRALLSEPIFLYENNCDGFAADTTWLIHMAMKGELIRVPEVLYHKRRHEASHFYPWNYVRKEEKTKAWLEHCKDCLKIIMMGGFNQDELNLLIEAIQSRLIDSLWYPKELRYDEKERALLLGILEKTITKLDKTNNKTNQVSEPEQI